MFHFSNYKPARPYISNNNARICAHQDRYYLVEIHDQTIFDLVSARCRVWVGRLGACLSIGLIVLVGPFGARAATPDAAIAAAVADPARPPEDVQRDVDRKPAASLAFAGIKPGDKVADYIANSGYFTRLLAGVVGPNGHVYSVELNEIVSSAGVAKGYAGLKDWAQGRGNVTIETGPSTSSPGFPEKLDAFWISQNYHDLHDKFLGPVDIAAFNKTVFAALKPGGVYIILDHVAASGAPADVTETLHRIDPAVVRREVEAAGFRFDGESPILANPADPHTVGMWDKTVKGRTDQFFYRFRKP
jgi:predicted methyltransferase